MVRDYWRRAGRRALAETLRTLDLTTWTSVMWKLAGAVVAILLLLFYGSEGASTDEMLARGAAVALVVLFFPFVYAWKLIGVPPAINQKNNLLIKELRKEIADTNESSKPCLIFQFHPNDNKNFEKITEKLNGRVKNSMCGRVTVKNASSVSIDDVGVTLQRWKKDGHSGQKSIDKKILSDSSGEASITVHSGRGASFNLFRTKTDNISFLKWGPFESGLTEQVSIGKYCVKVAASGKDTPPVTNFYFVHVNNGGVIEFRPWKDGDTTHNGPPLPKDTT